MRAAVILAAVLFALTGPACTKKNVRQSLASMAAAPVARNDWWEPRRDPDPTRPLGAEITHDPYANEEALFTPDPEQADALRAMSPIVAAIAIFLATGEMPTILYVQPQTPR